MESPFDFLYFIIGVGFIVFSVISAIDALIAKLKRAALIRFLIWVIPGLLSILWGLHSYVGGGM